MKKFNKITRKAFCDLISSRPSVLVYGGYCRSEIPEDTILSRCASFDTKSAPLRTATVKSSKIEFSLPDGSKSYLPFDDKGEKSYYQYGDVLIARNHIVKPANERCNYDTNTYAYCIYILV
jgi:hypothetical protein